MSNFICKVITPQGQIAKIKMEEEDKISCLKKIKRNGMTPISIRKSFNIFKQKEKRYLSNIKSKKNKKADINKNSILKLPYKVTIQEVKEFTEDFYFLKKSNFENKHAIITIINKTENLYLKQALKDILTNLENGNFMYRAMREYQDIFPKVYINLIKTGELSNSLELSLKNAITYLESEEKIRKIVIDELLPNAILFVMIFIILLAVILIGIPNLQNIFSSYGTNIQLPKITEISIKIINNILKYWYIIVLIIIGLLGIFFKFIKTESGKYKFDTFKYTNFLFGKFKFLVDFSRFVKCVLLNMQNKMRLQDSLEISKGVVSNVYMLNIIEKSINNVYIGKPWIEAFNNEEFVDTMTQEMLKKGYNSKSPKIIDEVINYLDKEIEKETDRILIILPEISYAVVGITILLFLIIILIPYIKIYLGGFLFI